MNSIVLIGRIVRDPELKYLPGSGKALCAFSLAVDRGVKDAEGKKLTDFIDCQVWGKQAEAFANYMRKGSRVAVAGQLQNNTYEKDGVRHYSYRVNALRVEFLTSKKGSGSDPDLRGYQEISDNDVPF